MTFYKLSSTSPNRATSAGLAADPRLHRVGESAGTDADRERRPPADPPVEHTSGEARRQAARSAHDVARQIADMGGAAQSLIDPSAVRLRYRRVDVDA